MKNFLLSLTVFLASLTLAQSANARILVINSENLEDFSMGTTADEKCSDNKIVVSGKKYTHDGCGGLAVWVGSLERVLSSPYDEKCTISETCWNGRCTRTYGRRQVNLTIKALVNSKGVVTRFVESEKLSSCQ